jgi:hypothetical protein
MDTVSDWNSLEQDTDTAQDTLSTGKVTNFVLLTVNEW